MPWYLGELPSGGSAVNPTEKGLNIPVNMAFAFHSDAGTTLNDSIIGTLGIYYTNAYNEKFANGASRYLSHDLTDLIQSNIVRDVRTSTNPNGHAGANGTNPTMRPVYPAYLPCYSNYFPIKTLQTCATDWTHVSVSP